MSYIELHNIKKSFDGKKILKGIDLKIERGVFATFLGPSGCGKTTLLRCLTGLEKIDEGQILIDGKDVTNIPAQKRGISMIFQQYCLFPTMTLYDNVSFGLRMNGVDRSEIRKRVNSVLDMVNMLDHVDKYPYQMSGGEQQRAALARGLVMKPKVLLMDEPFSAVDAKLRKELQVYLKEIHRNLGMTSIFVTHDQEEAMRMSDMIHLFNHGSIEQSGSPYEIYAEPKTSYGAGFIGSYNLISEDAFEKLTGIRQKAAIRPELITISDIACTNEDSYHLCGKVVNQIPQGSIIRHIIELDSGLRVSVDQVFTRDINTTIGDHRYLRIRKNDVVFLER